MIIVLFHVLYLFGKFIYQKYRINKQKAIDNDVTTTQRPLKISEKDYSMIDPEAPQDVEEKSIKFFPPAYVQRYVAVSDVLNSTKYQGKLRKVVDFGCAELGFLVYLKNTPGIEEILCVDINRVILESYKDKGAPLISEYLHTRTTPLVVEICEGSVTHNDKKLEKTDAVICIELVEHLYPNTLTDLPYNIFGFIKPKLAIITTPNADFNVLFPNFSGFRHYDHKFEWTRQQFQDWAENITIRYPEYTVTFSGICKGPEGSEHLGCCTQMAIFHRLSEKDSCNVGIEGLLVTVAKYEYPFRIDNRSDEQKILDEAEYYIRHLSFQESTMEEEVPLKKLLDMLKSFHGSIDILRSILEEAGWTVTNREFGPVVLVPPRSTFSDYSTGGEAVWSNDYSTTDEDDWNRDPGPPINSSRFLQDNSSSEVWDNENWDEEPSIFIPQNQSMIEDNTYLFDGENILLNNISETMRDTDISERYSETNNEENLDPEFLHLSNIDHKSANALNNPFQCDLSSDLKEFETTLDSPLNTTVENVKNDSFPDELHSLDVQECKMSNIKQKLNRTLDFLPCMSISRASTSPEPYLLQTVKMDQHLTYDSMCNQSMSNHWMLNSSLERVDKPLNITANASDDADMNFIDNRLCDIYLNASYKENNESSFECLSNDENSSSRYFSLNQTQSVQQDSNVPKNNSELQDQLQLNSSGSFTGCTLIESQPQFTSSPKINAKVNNTDRNEQSLDHNKQTNSSSSLKRLQQPYLITLCSNNSLENNEKVPLRTNNKINYNETQNHTCNNELEILKGRKDLTDTSNDDTLTSSDISIITSKLNDDKPMIEDLATMSSSSNDDSVKRHESFELDLTDNFIAIKEGKQPNLRVIRAIVTEKSKFAAIDPTNVEITNREKKVSLIDQQLVVEVKPCMESVHDKNEGKTDTKSGLYDVCSLRNDNVNNAKSCHSHSKQINSLGPKSSITSENIQKQPECNIETYKFICKNIHPNTSEILENVEIKTFPLETVESPPKSWSPEIMDSGYPNSASAQDVTPEYDLSSIAQDHISDSEPPSIAEAPRVDLAPEDIEVENGDLVNNNRDNEGNNMMAVELNDLEDLQPLINVLEHDLENENDIYAVENGFPLWLLRILNMANPVDVEMHVQDHREIRFLNREAGEDARYMNLENDEGFDSSSEESSNLENNELRNNSNSNASDNIENDNENVSNSDSGGEEWAIAGDS